MILTANNRDKKQSFITIYVTYVMTQLVKIQRNPVSLRNNNNAITKYILITKYLLFQHRTFDEISQYTLAMHSARIPLIAQQVGETLGPVLAI